MTSFRPDLRTYYQTRDVWTDVEHLWRNLEGLFHFVLFLDGHSVDANLYAQQMQRLFDGLIVRYLTLVKRRLSLLRHSNAPTCSINVSKYKPEGSEMLPRPAYSLNFSPLDYHLFRTMLISCSDRGSTVWMRLKTDAGWFFPLNQPSAIT